MSVEKSQAEMFDDFDLDDKKLNEIG